MIGARRVAPLVLAAVAVLAGCAGVAVPPPAGAPGAPVAGGVSRSVEQGGRFIALVGEKRQHAPPFLGVPGTNYYVLRSWIDARSGEAAHQLYVSDSYAGAERNWDAARDGQGRQLRFTAISRNEIACSGGCSYAEEFAAALPETLLRGSSDGLTVVFAARSGAERSVAVPGDLIRNQLAAVDSERSRLPVAPAAAPGR